MGAKVRNIKSRVGRVLGMVRKHVIFYETQLTHQVQPYCKMELLEIKISKNTEFSRLNLRLCALTTMNKQRQF